MGSAKGQRSLASIEAASERHQGFRAVGVAVSKLATAVAAKRGGGMMVRLKADWSAIVGPEWALVAWPVALGRDGVLKLHTRPMAALELQHRAPLLIERINLYFGRPMVTRLTLIQATLPASPEPLAPAMRSPVDGDATVLDPRLSDIADPELRAALGRLARAIVAAGE
jgi:hypothetical protein